MGLVGGLLCCVGDMLFDLKGKGNEKLGMKQSDLAELVNVRRETIVCLENGRYNPSLKLAMDIAKVFNVQVEDLFSFIDEDTEK